VAIKVFGAAASETERSLDKLLRPSVHRGKEHVELALDSFIIHGPNGNHFCKVLEPLGRAFSSVLESAFEKRAELNSPQGWLGSAVGGDGWSAQSAKRACWQVLLGLDYLHSQRIAHRDIQPANICMALQCDLSSLHENEIQRSVWPPEDERTANGKSVRNAEKTQANEEKNIDLNDKTASDEDTDSDDEPKEEWQREFEDGERGAKHQWEVFEHGDELAEPHSVEWNKANFFNSRHNIELLRRKDGRPLKADEIRYTVAPSPLNDAAHLNQSSRLVLIDLGFSCAFEDCEQRPLRNLSDFRPPEALLGVAATHKADVFSAGLLFWEIVMLRRLVETRFVSNDPERTYQKNRLLRDLSQRLGPVPATIRAQWHDADKFLDPDGNALDMQEQDDEIYGPDDFEFGDIWHHAKIRKPLDMSDTEMEIFVDLIRKMLQWEPTSRPSTAELLGHKWFADVRLEP
jgi:serine/threonine protein kinase